MKWHESPNIHIRHLHGFLGHNKYYMHHTIAFTIHLYHIMPFTTHSSLVHSSVPSFLSSGVPILDMTSLVIINTHTWGVVVWTLPKTLNEIVFEWTMFWLCFYGFKTLKDIWKLFLLYDVLDSLVLLCFCHSRWHWRYFYRSWTLGLESLHKGCFSTRSLYYSRWVSFYRLNKHVTPFKFINEVHRFMVDRIFEFCAIVWSI